MIEIIDEKDHSKGVVYTLKANDRITKILFLILTGILREAMFLKIKYSKDADILLIELKDGNPVDSINIKEGVILRLDDKGLPLEIEILDASKVAMLKEISVISPIEA